MLKLLEPGKFDVNELSRKSGFTVRKVHYLLTHVLNDYVTDNLGITPTRGKRTQYPEEVLMRLLFLEKALNQLQEQEVAFNYTRTELKDWMNHITDEEVRNVVNDSEPLVFGYQLVKEDKLITETLDGERLSPDSRKYGRQISTDDSEEDELPAIESQDPNSINLIEYIEGNLQRSLSASKRNQIKIIDELLQSILHEER